MSNVFYGPVVPLPEVVRMVDEPPRAIQLTDEARIERGTRSLVARAKAGDWDGINAAFREAAESQGLSGDDLTDAAAELCEAVAADASATHYAEGDVDPDSARAAKLAEKYEADGMDADQAASKAFREVYE